MSLDEFEGSLVSLWREPCFFVPVSGSDTFELVRTSFVRSGSMLSGSRESSGDFYRKLPPGSDRPAGAISLIEPLDFSMHWMVKMDKQEQERS